MVESKSFLSKKQMDQLSHYSEEPVSREVQERRDRAFEMFKNSEQKYEKTQEETSKSSSGSKDLFSQIGETLTSAANTIRNAVSGNNKK